MKKKKEAVFVKSAKHRVVSEYFFGFDAAENEFSKVWYLRAVSFRLS